MTTHLPAGIVTTTASIGPEINTVDHVDVQDIARLWKAYSNNRNILPNYAGRRLENVFWRIWSSRTIHENITGSTVAKLFMTISEDRGIIRTTPVQSPRSGRGYTSSITCDGPSKFAPASRQPTEPQEAAELVAPSSSSPERTRSGPLPPILKNAAQYRESSSQTALSMHRSGSNESGSSVERKINFASPRPPTPPASHRRSHAEQFGANQGNNGKKKKTTFAAGSNGGRRRPMVMRRKSSQSSGGTSSSVKSTSSLKLGQEDDTTETLDDDDLGASMIAREVKGKMKAETPQDQRVEHVQAVAGDARPDAAPPPRRKSWVLNRARSDLAEKVNPERRSHTDLSAMAAKDGSFRHPQKTGPTQAATSAAAVGKVELGSPDLPFTKDKGKGRWKQAGNDQPSLPTFVDRVEPLKQEGPSEHLPSQPRASQSSAQAVSGPQPLQRTRSQLTLLLERDRMQNQAISSPSDTGPGSGSGRGRQEKSGAAATEGRAPSS